MSKLHPIARFFHSWSCCQNTDEKFALILGAMLADHGAGVAFAVIPPTKTLCDMENDDANKHFCNRPSKMRVLVIADLCTDDALAWERYKVNALCASLSNASGTYRTFATYDFQRVKAEATVQRISGSDWQRFCVAPMRLDGSLAICYASHREIESALREPISYELLLERWSPEALMRFAHKHRLGGRPSKWQTFFDGRPEPPRGFWVLNNQWQQKSPVWLEKEAIALQKCDIKESAAFRPLETIDEEEFCTFLRAYLIYGC